MNSKPQGIDKLKVGAEEDSSCGPPGSADGPLLVTLGLSLYLSAGLECKTQSPPLAFLVFQTDADVSVIAASQTPSRAKMETITQLQRKGLNSQTLSQGGTDPLLWVPTSKETFASHKKKKIVPSMLKLSDKQ